MSINYTGNKFGNVELADGRSVVLTQQAHIENNSSGGASWYASGYLSTENPDDETGPTVQVEWASRGAEEAEDDADWGAPVAAVHYALGELPLAA